MLYKFKDDNLQKEYEDKKKTLIDKYGEGCSAVCFSQILLESRIDGSLSVDVIATFEKNDIEDDKVIEDGDNIVSYVTSFKEYEIEEDDFTEIIKL